MNDLDLSHAMDLVGRNDNLETANARLKAENARLRKALGDATANLAGATSAYAAYAGNSKCPGARDAAYTTRLGDFEKALFRALEALNQ